MRTDGNRYFYQRKQANTECYAWVHQLLRAGEKNVDKNGRQYVGGVNCLGQHAYDEFMATKNLYGKASGIYFYQYVQSFAPGEIKSYDEAHRIGM